MNRPVSTVVRETIDPAVIHVGDEVLIRATVANKTNPDNWGFHFEHVTAGNATHYAKPSSIAGFTPRPLGVGDAVTRSPAGNTRGEIKHVIDGRAWVDWSSGQQLIHQLSDLERAK